MAKKGAKMRWRATGKALVKKSATLLCPGTKQDDAEVSLPHTVPQPMEAHVKRLRHLEIDGVGCETDGDFIVAE